MRAEKKAEPMGYPMGLTTVIYWKGEKMVGKMVMKMVNNLKAD